MATSTVLTNKPINPRGDDNRPVDSYNRASLFSGKALDFDGVNDYVSAPNISVQSSNVWTYTSNVKFDDDLAYWFDARTSNTGYSVYLGSNRHLTLYDSVAGALDLDFTFEFGQWYSIALTSDGTNAKLYVNGVLADTISYTQSHTSTGNFVIGVRHSLDAYWYNGNISGFKAFNTALTATQVADLYNNPEKVVPTGVSNTALKLWLPMMEGAGTTAYDGSGNGNHGTISGATYVNGVGAPVAQSAVMDWNKGTNLLVYSEQFDNTAWAENRSNCNVTANATTAPNGETLADEIEFTATDSSIFDQFVNVASSMHIGSVWVKNNDIDSVRIRIQGNSPSILGSVDVNLTNGTLSNQVGDFTPTIEDYGDGWYRVAVGDTGTATIANPILAFDYTSATGSFYAWGAQVEAADSLGAYIPTLSTPQTTPVLLPQGLTTGRDITGVNLFENVRKQGALNLDGNSWAEVHDNASLDFGTGSFTLEAWIKGKFVSQGSVFNMVISLGGNITSSNNAGLMVLNNTVPYFIYSNPGALTGSAQTEGDWIHMVGTYDQTNTRFYVNGVQTGQSARTAADITNEFVKVIGRDGTDPNRFYNDQIAQPRIYNRALTASEVLNNFNATKDLYI